MKYNPESKEQVITLTDGRELYKTHNGFRIFLKDKNGKVIPISQNYYSKIKRSL